MIADELRKYFVPAPGITLAVLRANLPRYFPEGAKISRVQLYDGTEQGWFITGGIVTTEIIKSLQYETQAQALRDGLTAAQQILGEKSTKEHQQSACNDEIRSRNGAVPSRLSQPADGRTSQSPTVSRHQQPAPGPIPAIKAIPVATRTHTADFPGCEQYTDENYQDHRAFRAYLSLQRRGTDRDRHKGVPIQPLEAPPPYQAARHNPNPGGPRFAQPDMITDTTKTVTAANKTPTNRHESTAANQNKKTDNANPRRRRPSPSRRVHFE